VIHHPSPRDYALRTLGGWIFITTTTPHIAGRDRSATQIFQRAGQRWVELLGWQGSDQT
jgi:hypothetical protein